MHLEFPKGYNIPATLFCGQTFLWQKTPQGFIGCVGQKSAFLKEKEQRYYLEADEEDYPFFIDYFDMERDYESIYKQFLHDEVFLRAYCQWPGLRILRQPVWETLCSFIISANNHMKRIMGITQRLCMSFGEKQVLSGQTVYSFPTAKMLSCATLQTLRDLGLGYRAPYLLSTAQRVADGYDLEKIKSLGYATALKELMSFSGVGEKVADCVLLFSCGYMNAFPMDTWMIKVMRQAYGAKGTRAQMKKQGMQLFGEYAGIAQQVLFYAAKEGKGLILPERWP